MVPELEEEKPNEDAIEEDMEDILKRRKEIEDAKLAAEMRKRSQSVQKDLPRPLSMKGAIRRFSKNTYIYIYIWQERIPHTTPKERADNIMTFQIKPAFLPICLFISLVYLVRR